MANKTVAERQKTFRAQKKAAGFVEVTMWVKAETAEKLEKEALRQSINKGEVIDFLMVD